MMSSTKIRHCIGFQVAKKLATSNLPFQEFEGFIPSYYFFSNLGSFFLRKFSICTFADLILAMIAKLRCSLSKTVATPAPSISESTNQFVQFLMIYDFSHFSYFWLSKNHAFFTLNDYRLDTQCQVDRKIKIHKVAGVSYNSFLLS